MASLALLGLLLAAACLCAAGQHSECISMPTGAWSVASERDGLPFPRSLRLSLHTALPVQQLAYLVAMRMPDRFPSLCYTTAPPPLPAPAQAASRRGTTPRCWRRGALRA